MKGCDKASRPGQSEGSWFYRGTEGRYPVSPVRTWTSNAVRRLPWVIAIVGVSMFVGCGDAGGEARESTASESELRAPVGVDENRKGIDPDLYAMMARFRNRGDAARTSVGGVDPEGAAFLETTAVWFDIETVVRLLGSRLPKDVVERASQSLLASGVTGIRFHHAIYPENSGVSSGQRTLVMMATEGGALSGFAHQDIEESGKNRGKISPPY